MSYNYFDYYYGYYIYYYLTNESNAETHCHCVVLILSVHMVINIICFTTHLESTTILHFLQATVNVINKNIYISILVLSND